MRPEIEEKLSDQRKSKDESSFLAKEEQGANNRQSNDKDKEEDIVSIYFDRKMIRPLFDFMVQHLIINEPDNPIEYLKDLMDKLLMWRSGTVVRAPHLFELRHVEAIYRALDPAPLGSISLEQYHNGFKTLMLNNYNLCPKHDKEGLVEKSVFIENAMSALDKYLMDLVRPPYTTLCELTILPDESYDILFQEYQTLRTGSTVSTSVDKPDAATDSCPSEASCVKLVPREEEEHSSMTSDVSYISMDEISVADMDMYDFLIKAGDEDQDKRGTVPGSKITMMGGKTGYNAKSLVSSDINLESVTVVAVDQS